MAYKLSHGELLQFVKALDEDRTQFKNIKPEVIFRRVLKIGEKIGLDEVYNGLQAQAIAVGKISEMQRRVVSTKFCGEVISFTAADADWFTFALEREPIKDSSEWALNFVATVRDDVNHVIYDRVIGVIARERTGSGIQGVFRTVADICDEKKLPTPPAPEPKKEEAEKPAEAVAAPAKEATPPEAAKPAEEPKPEQSNETTPAEAPAGEADAPEASQEDLHEPEAVAEPEPQPSTDAAPAETTEGGDDEQQEQTAEQKDDDDEVVIKKDTEILFRHNDDEVVLLDNNMDEVYKFTDPDADNIDYRPKYKADVDITRGVFKGSVSEIMELFSIVDETPNAEKKEEKEMNEAAEERIEPYTVADIGCDPTYCGHLLTGEMVKNAEAKQGNLYIVDDNNSLVAFDGKSWITIGGADADEIFRQIKEHEAKPVADIDAPAEKTQEAEAPDETADGGEEELPTPVGDQPEFKHVREEHTKGEYLEMLFGTPAPTILHVLNYIKSNDDSETFKLTGTHAIEQLYVFSDYTFSIIRMKNGCYYRIFVAHTDTGLGNNMTWFKSREDKNRWFVIADVSDREINRVVQMRG